MVELQLPVLRAVMRDTVNTKLARSMEISLKFDGGAETRKKLAVLGSA